MDVSNLKPAGAPLTFENAMHETGWICLNGAAKVSTGEQKFNLNRCGALYVPRDSRIEAATEIGCNLAELSAEIENKYRLQFVAFEEIRQNPALHFTAGKPPTARDLNILIEEKHRSRTNYGGRYVFGGRKSDEPLRATFCIIRRCACTARRCLMKKSFWQIFFRRFGKIFCRISLDNCQFLFVVVIV